jgi:hypothetical protein
MINDRRDPRTQYLDGDFTAIRQDREMDLGDGGGGHRLCIKGSEHLFHGLAVDLFQFGPGKYRRKGWHPILEFCQFVGDIHRQQVAPS